MSQLRVLISGASVAGPALAYWLVRAGCKVTVVERAPRLRVEGQGVDVRDTARDVIRRMGIFDTMRDRSSHEEGFEMVDGNNRPFARFAVDLSGKGDSLTCDIEILRGELARILYDLTKDDVSYLFGDTIESLKQTEKEVAVTFTNGTPTSSFDLVVAADGLGSKVRSMVFGNDTSHIRSLGSYVSYFSIPLGETDTRWSRAHWLKRGRYMAVRPDNIGRTRVFFGLTAYDQSSDERLVRMSKAAKEGIPAQKRAVNDLFADADWEISRFLKGMHDSDDFYLQHIAQIRLPSWSRGRVTVVGDAGYAPSPFTGMGTSIAFIGAYVLAGEISKRPNDVPKALEAYEQVLRPYVESIQKLPPGIPWIVNPQTAWGVKVFETVIWGIGVLSKWGVTTLLSNVAAYVPKFGGAAFKLPEYEAFTKEK